MWIKQIHRVFYRKSSFYSYLKDQLAAGRPVVVSSRIDTIIFHAYVVVGYDSNSDKFYVQDPQNNERPYEKLLIDEKYFSPYQTLVIPKELNPNRSTTTINIRTNEVGFSGDVDINFIWDDNKEKGYSYRDFEKIPVESVEKISFNRLFLANTSLENKDVILRIKISPQNIMGGVYKKYVGPFEIGKNTHGFLRDHIDKSIEIYLEDFLIESEHEVVYDISLSLHQDDTILNKKEISFTASPYIIGDYQLNISTDGEGTTNPAEGTHTYNAGETVSISAYRDEGWEFSYWEGDVTNSSSAETTIIMDDDKDVTVVFEEEAESEIVEFEDSNLEADIREIINKSEGDIYLEDVINIKVLETDGRGDRMVESFDGIQSLKNLEELYFLGYGIDDLTPIAELTNLKTLGFGSWEPTFIEDISPIGNLTNLENLYIGANRASDISVIGNLVNLKELVLWRSVVDGDISFLANLENLEYLNLHSNGIEDISVLTSFKNLRYLDIGDNNVKDISPIKNLTIIRMIFIILFL